MKSWHAGLIWLAILAVVVLTCYTAPESGRSAESFVVSSTPDNLLENDIEIIIDFDMEGLPLQIELIKPFKDTPSRAILRTGLSESPSTQDLHKVLMKLSDGDGKLGQRNYRLICIGSPMAQRFQSIIEGYGSFDCIMVGLNWTLDRENRIITVKGNQVIQNLASQNQQ
jgi:hypothetical protein